MAITIKIAATVAAVAGGAGNQFTTTGPFILYGDSFEGGEKCELLRLGPSATYHPATNKEGKIVVGSEPNMVYVEAPGTYRLKKTATRLAASVGYEEL